MSSGLCIWFTGLSGAGKSTLAKIVSSKFDELDLKYDILDGDEVRLHLSKGLGFSKEDRDTNIRRIGYVCTKIVKHGGIVMAAAISPYRSIRDEVRKMVEDVGGRFVEVYVDTPLHICEQRDVKGLYKRARTGELKEFTGVSDPYEAPLDPEIAANTTDLCVEESASAIMTSLKNMGLIARI